MDMQCKARYDDKPLPSVSLAVIVQYKMLNKGSHCDVTALYLKHRCDVTVIYLENYCDVTALHWKGFPFTFAAGISWSEQINKHAFTSVCHAWTKSQVKFFFFFTVKGQTSNLPSFSPLRFLRHITGPNFFVLGLHFLWTVNGGDMLIKQLRV